MADDRASSIRQQMTTIRGAVRDDVETIVDNARLTADWRYYVHQYPWACAAASAAIGYFVVPRGPAKVVVDPKMFEAIVQKHTPAASEPEKPAPTALGGLWSSVVLPFLLRNGANAALSLAESAWRSKSDKPERDLNEAHVHASKPR